MENKDLYPILPDEQDISLQISKTIDNANEVRIKFIKDFKKILKNDFIKYRNKKRRYSLIKNILMCIDILGGGILVISGLIIETVSFGSLTIVSIAIGSIGVLMVGTIPLSSKLCDLGENKNRLFENLSVKKLNQVRGIFSKALEDGIITHEEFLLVNEVKIQYEIAKSNLKTQNKKEVEKLLNDNTTMDNKENKESFKKKLEFLEKEIKKLKK